MNLLSRNATEFDSKYGKVMLEILYREANQDSLTKMKPFISLESLEKDKNNNCTHHDIVMPTIPYEHRLYINGVDTDIKVVNDDMEDYMKHINDMLDMNYTGKYSKVTQYHTIILNEFKQYVIENYPEYFV